MRKVFVVAYDIVDDNIRNEIHDFLSLFGLRIQRSVFILWIPSNKIKDIKREILKKLQKEDRILIMEINEFEEINNNLNFSPFKNVFVID